MWNYLFTWLIEILLKSIDVIYSILDIVCMYGSIGDPGLEQRKRLREGEKREREKVR